MDVCISRRLVFGLTLTLVWMASGPGHAQGIDPAMLSLDSSYPSWSNTNIHPVSTATAPKNRSLADEVAELRAWRAEVDSQAAAAKKKAAAKPSLSIGGRVFADTAMFDQNPNSLTQIGDIENGTELRAAWLAFNGSMFNVIDYKLQFDLAGQTSMKDVYLGIRELPLVSNVRIGHFKEPFGMEQLTASKFVTFMERAPGDSGVFVPGRNMGVMAYDCTENERATWAIGAFVSEQGEKPPFYQEDHEGAALTMRTTYTPWYDEATQGRGLLHTGLAYSYRALGDETTRLRGRPEAHLAPRVIDTGIINASDMQLAGAELAFLYGPFCFQSEYYGASVNQIGGGDLAFTGYYAYVSYFLTGENRRYNRKAGTFSNRIIPFENFFRVRDEDGRIQMGKGAWELAYRYSSVDLDDGQIQGGQVSDHTFGLNWYLTPYTRIMWNYINSTTDRAGVNDGVVNIFQMRAQVDF